MASTERELIIGVWGTAPSGVRPGAEPMVRRSGGKPLKLKAFCGSDIQRKGQTGGLIVMNVIWSHFLFGTPQKTAS